MTFQSVQKCFYKFIRCEGYIPKRIYEILTKQNIIELNCVDVYPIRKCYDLPGTYKLYKRKV